MFEGCHYSTAPKPAPERLVFCFAFCSYSPVLEKIIRNLKSTHSPILLGLHWPTSGVHCHKHAVRQALGSGVIMASEGSRVCGVQREGLVGSMGGGKNGNRQWPCCHILTPFTLQETRHRPPQNCAHSRVPRKEGRNLPWRKGSIKH